MDIRQKDAKGALEILRTLPKKEFLDFKNNKYRKNLKLINMFILYIDDSPISFLEIYKINEKDKYIISMTKEKFRGDDRVYYFRRNIMDTLK